MYDKKYYELNKKHHIKVSNSIRKTRQRRLRDEALEILGNECFICKTQQKLELHHVIYAEDSVKSGESGHSLKRIEEALAYPDRFLLLCRTCHRVHSILKNDVKGEHKLKCLAYFSHIISKEQLEQKVEIE